jgi:UDP-N-acetylmuramate: L-alanyl-gamma-D-glutamyl-meso-diaminopimelate ligase
LNQIMKKKAYFIGIAGKTMGALAKAFKDMGWEVSGSDQVGIYPPISTYLKENQISYIEGYRAENVPEDADLVVMGRSAMMIDSNHPEHLRAKELGYRVYSYPEALQEYVIKDKSLVVAGTYGKTTLSAALAWVLTKAGLNPSYMTGGVPVNEEIADGVRITDSSYSVVEGDEPPSLRETDSPKFMFYQPKYLLLTATIHDHPEIYKTPEDYIKAFVDLVKLIPPEGILVFNQENVDQTVVESFSGKKVSYSFSNSKADFYVANYARRGEITDFAVKGQGKKYQLKTSLLGQFNLENLCGAVALCSQLEIDKEVIAQAIKSFKGLKTRLEYLGDFAGRRLYWDFSQHPSKVKGALEALREHYPQSQIICVFDPKMTGLKYRESLGWYPGAFDQADQVIVGQVSFLKSVPREKRVTGRDIVEAIGRSQSNVFYQPIGEKIISWLEKNSQSGDVVVFMSSGGMEFVNLINDTIRALAD